MTRASPFSLARKPLSLDIEATPKKTDLSLSGSLFHRQKWRLTGYSCYYSCHSFTFVYFTNAEKLALKVMHFFLPTLYSRWLTMLPLPPHLQSDVPSLPGRNRHRIHDLVTSLDSGGHSLLTGVALNTRPPTALRKQRAPRSAFHHGVGRYRCRCRSIRHRRPAEPSAAVNRPKQLLFATINDASTRKCDGNGVGSKQLGDVFAPSPGHAWSDEKRSSCRGTEVSGA